MIQSNLFGYAKEICRKILDAQDGILKALFKQNALSTVSVVYQDFIALLKTWHGETEAFKNYESRFKAKISKLIWEGASCILTEA